MIIDRRFLLRSTGALILSGIASRVGASVPDASTRRLCFQCTHTGERVDAEYWTGGRYVQDAMMKINQVLRDFRTDEVYPMDPKLIDLLHSLHRSLESQEAFHVISGYRSPATNGALRSKSDGVATKSLHMQGMAVDIRLPDREIADVHRAALALQAGGVGYYPASDFVHIDVGRVRRW